MQLYPMLWGDNHINVYLSATIIHFQFVLPRGTSMLRYLQIVPKNMKIFAMFKIADL